MARHTVTINHNSFRNKSIHKNSDDNTYHHYSSTLLSNHETANIHNKTTKQWNRNSDTVVWNKQNLMSRLSTPFKHHTVNPTSQSTITDVWSKQSYDSHRKNIIQFIIRNAKQSSCPAQSMTSQAIAIQLQANTYHHPNSPEPRLIAFPNYYKLIYTKSINNRTQINQKVNDSINSSSSTTNTTPPSPIPTSSKRQTNKQKLKNDPFGDILTNKSTDSIRILSQNVN